MKCSNDITIVYRDEDMQSMASLMSTTNNNDIATLEDFDEDEEKDSKCDGGIIKLKDIFLEYSI